MRILNELTPFGICLCRSVKKKSNLLYRQFKILISNESSYSNLAGLLA